MRQVIDSGKRSKKIHPTSVEITEITIERETAKSVYCSHIEVFRVRKEVLTKIVPTVWRHS